MRTIGCRVASVLAVAAIAGGLSSCGRFLAVEAQPEEEWEEVFEFVIRPGTENPAEAERAINAFIGPEGIVPGSAAHRGSVTAPGGQVEFYSYRQVDSAIGTQPMSCTAVVATSSMSAGCGDGPDVARQPIQVSGESSGGLWRSAEFSVQADVASVEATAEDGTVYTVTPLNGFGYIEWSDERGSLELIAYDAQDQELGRAFAGLDR